MGEIFELSTQRDEMCVCAMCNVICPCHGSTRPEFRFCDIEFYGSEPQAADDVR